MFRELEKPHPSIKLLYTTPEQLQSSEGLLNCMQRLYERCVSISVLAPILSHVSLLPPALCSAADSKQRSGQWTAQATVSGCTRSNAIPLVFLRCIENMPQRTHRPPHCTSERWRNLSCQIPAHHQKYKSVFLRIADLGCSCTCGL